jgi:hypothetical protein
VKRSASACSLGSKVEVDDFILTALRCIDAARSTQDLDINSNLSLFSVSTSDCEWLNTVLVRVLGLEQVLPDTSVEFSEVR